jgi:hypothetical protein
MELAKSNAFPSLASNLVLGVPCFMSVTGPHKLQRYVQGVVSTMGCWARPAIYPWLLAYRQTRGG